MKKLLLIGIATFLVACGGVKKTQEAINLGDYGSAIDKSIKNLAQNKTKKGNQPYIVLLEEAYRKNTERELKNIAFLEKDDNPSNYEAIYNGYNDLRSFQQRIKPLLPLTILEENRNAKFKFRDYSDDLLDAKEQLSEYLYDNAEELMNNAVSKFDFRKAYDDFKYLNEINPGFEDSEQLMQIAYEKGLHYVKVAVVNQTQQIIPARLEQDLLNFNTYGLDELWTRYHTNPQDDIMYDYDMNIAFRSISVSPERVNEKQIVKERRIKDGYRYATDTDGAIVKDSLGNKIKVDRFKTVQCNFYQFTQFKTAKVDGAVHFVDLQTKQEINSYPISSEFVFEHVYANYDGDKRALDNDLVSLLNLAEIPFPTNEQMVYDAGKDLKMRIKEILKRQRFN
ncbi:hypothetical protein FGM00_08975 [Aggregatimonas sangjinii]|uniref:Lipoprotein n=1 Tax=Aggregatimonas sangjinii TaxID=2583587 RepID=A0A5B7SNT8_9FLAO|nr:hypothetical protein [Aggregatimonas sangjinii]QCX00236.1 hypothetical protein FGM00_08975 [Aggregatimonas sangjinii]